MCEVEVLHQRMTEMARADNDETPQLVHAEDMADFRTQFHDVIPIALLAEFAETAQILTDLRGGNTHAFAERAG